MLIEKEKKDENIKMSYLNLTLYLGKQKKACSGLNDETTNGNMRSAQKKGKKNIQTSHVTTSCYKFNKKQGYNYF